MYITDSSFSKCLRDPQHLPSGDKAQKLSQPAARHTITSRACHTGTYTTLRSCVDTDGLSAELVSSVTWAPDAAELYIVIPSPGSLAGRAEQWVRAADAEKTHTLAGEMSSLAPRSPGWAQIWQLTQFRVVRVFREGFLKQSGTCSGKDIMFASTDNWYKVAVLWTYDEKPTCQIISLFSVIDFVLHVNQNRQATV